MRARCILDWRALAHGLAVVTSLSCGARSDLEQNDADSGGVVETPPTRLGTNGDGGTSGATNAGSTGFGGRVSTGGFTGTGGLAGAGGFAGAGRGGSGGALGFCMPNAPDLSECEVCVQARCCQEWLACVDEACTLEAPCMTLCTDDVFMMQGFVDEDTVIGCATECAHVGSIVADTTNDLVSCILAPDTPSGGRNCAFECYRLE